jgi:hypothetical protein
LISFILGILGNLGILGICYENLNSSSVIKCYCVNKLRRRKC